MIDYRNDARRELARAKDELASADAERLKYAALELRMAMESITYDRALAFKDEFSPAEYEKWQPRKVLATLLEIDPDADKDRSIAFGSEPSPGVTPDVMQSLGTERVLNMKTIKRHYDALGSYLHVPTIKQSKDGARTDDAKFRARCEEIAAYLTEVLASPVWNATMGRFASFACKQCGHQIRKRMPPRQTVVNAKCSECVATYKLTDAGDGKLQCKPDREEVKCTNSECNTPILLWHSQIEHGVNWNCKVCGGQNEILLTVHHRPKAAIEAP